MKRGSVCWVNLEPAKPPEFGKVRPALVVSNSEQNNRLPTVVVVPLSSQAPEIWPLRIRLKIQDNKESFAVIPGIRQVSKQRIGEMIGLVPQSFLEQLDEALKAYLND